MSPHERDADGMARQARANDRIQAECGSGPLALHQAAIIASEEMGEGWEFQLNLIVGGPPRVSAIQWAGQ